MADLVISVGINASGTRKGANDAKREIKAIGDTAETAKKKTSSLATSLDFNKINRQISESIPQLQRFSSIIDKLPLRAGAVAAAISAVAVGIAAIAKLSFNLAKQFADFTTEIGKAQEVTGLTARTLSSLRFQVEANAGSFPKFVNNIKSFIKTIGDANNGSKEASAKLQRLGIDAQRAAGNLDGAFRQALNRILALPPGVQRTSAAMDAFGDDVTDILPILKSFGGNVDDVIRRAEELGVVLSKKDVQAGREFNKTMAEIKAVLQSIGITFGREVLPTVKKGLDDINSWLISNRDSIQSWAEAFARIVRNLKSQIEKEFDDIRGIIDTINYVAGGFQGPTPHQLYQQRQTARYYANLPAPVVNQAVQNEVQTRLPGLNYERPYFTSPVPTVRGSGGGSGRSRAASVEMTEEQKQAKRFMDIIASLNKEIVYFDKNTKEMAVSQQLFGEQITATNLPLAKQALALGKQIDLMKETADAQQKATEYAKRFADEKHNIVTQSYLQNVSLGAEANALKLQIELGRELTVVERKQIDDAAEMLKYRRELQEKGYKQADIDVLVSIAEAEQAHTREILEQVQAKRELIEAEQRYRDLIGGLNSEYADLTRQLYEITTGTEMSRVAVLQLSDAYRQLTPAQQDAARARAADIDAMREAIRIQQEAQRAYDDLYNNIRNSLEILSDQGFGAFFKDVFRKFKSFLVDMVTEWLTSKLFSLFFKGGNAQMAQQNGGGLLGAIFGGGGNTAGAAGGGLFGGNQGGGIFNFGGGGSTANNSIITLPNGEQAVQVNGSGGGLFGRMGGLSGMFGMIGGGLGILGGAIGGRAGGFLSNIGTGVGIGAQIGSIIPGIGTVIGAAVGGIVGLFSSIFGGDPKRKRDKNEKIPALNQGFVDALRQLRELIGDVRTLRVDPDSAIAKAQELRQQIASGFGIEFESKKYRGKAQEMIAAKLREADSLIEELRAAADVARAAGERRNRIIPEFAQGVYMSPAFQRFREVNGMLPGSFTGRDRIPAMLADGEMVLNPRQQRAVRLNAGGRDVFSNAGIPGYAGGGVVSAPASSGGPVVVQLTFEHSIDANGMVHTALKSPQNQDRVRVIVEDKYANDSLKLKRRGA